MPTSAPASIEAEQALLGSMFLYPETFRLAFEENLQPSDFFSDSNRKIYQVIVSLNEEKKPTDVASVITRLTDLQQLDNIGGVDYIMHLTDVAITSANSAYYITSIQEKALLRKLIEVSENIKKKSYEDQYNAADVLNEAESMILKVSRDRKTTEFKTSKDAFDEVIANIMKLQKTGGMTGVPSGYKYLDNNTNGFQNGDLIIVAARPSVGKTAFALNIASNAAVTYNKTIALFSLEMPVLHLTNRMLSAKSGVDSDKIRTGRYLLNSDWARIDEAKGKLEKAKLYMDDSSSIKVNDIFSKCRKLKETDGLDMVIVDYLQLIQPSTSKSDNRQQEVSEISRSLKQMARELDVPVIALSQLSRAVESKDRDPQLSDLRESGAIEQDADVVIFLHREKKATEEENEDDNQRVIKVIIAKHRNGSIGSIELAFDNATNAFIDIQYGNQNE